MTVATNSHIEIDEQGRPRIADTGFKVKFIAIHTLMGETPAQIQEAFPHLSLVQIHSALAYYYDHKVEMDAQIEAEGRYAEESRAAAIAAGTQPTRAELERRLRDRGQA